jgi:hypothetical protein
MSVEEVIAEFGTIVEEAYANDLEPTERTEKLKKSLEALLARRSLPIDAKLRNDSQDGQCAGYASFLHQIARTFISQSHRFALAARSVNVGGKVYLRTYPVKSQPSFTITIIDAALATCASPSEFLPVSFGTGYQRQEFIGAGLAASNPVGCVIDEAQRLFGGDSVVASLLSLGSGHPGILSLSRDSGIDALHRLALEMILDCEQKAQEIQQQIGQVGVYFRFSVEHGMQRGRFPQAQEFSSMLAQTESYLTNQETEEKLDHLVHNLKATVGVISLNQLSMCIPSLFDFLLISSINRIDGLNTIASKLIARGNNTQYFVTSEVRTESTQSSAQPLHQPSHQATLFSQAASLYACGEPCSLVQEDGTRLCHRVCIIDW